jgi:hypothetical protein
MAAHFISHRIRNRSILENPRERLETAQVDAQSLAPILRPPGPQRRGTGGTLNLIGFP